MISWLASNGSTILIALILVGLVVLAFKKRKKSGGCGCGSCSNCHLDSNDKDTKR